MIVLVHKRVIRTNLFNFNEKRLRLEVHVLGYVSCTALQRHGVVLVGWGAGTLADLCTSVKGRNVNRQTFQTLSMRPHHAVSKRRAPLAH